MMGLVDAVRGLDGVRLVIAGIGKSACVASLLERSRKVPDVEFLGAVPREEILPLTLKANAVVSLRDPSDKNN